MLDATRLRVLVAIARHGSVTAAAQALNYAQPSISHHMARLESETGVKLMERAGRGIRLTDAGKLLADRAEEILGRLDAAEAELAAHVGLRQDKVRLAAFGSALGTLAAAAGSALRAERAVTDISLTQAEPAEALRMLKVGEADVALIFRYVHEPGRLASGRPGGNATARDPLRRRPEVPDDAAAGIAGEDDLRFETLLDEPVYLITPTAQPAQADKASAADPGGQPTSAGGQSTGHGSRPARCGGPSAGHGGPSIAEYAGHRWIAGCERCQDILVQLCRSAGFAPDIAVTTDDYAAAQALVAAGLGVAILPGLALRALRHPKINVTEVPGIRRHVLAVIHAGPPERRAAAALVAALADAASELDNDPVAPRLAGIAR